jgi:hypothetical protein
MPVLNVHADSLATSTELSSFSVEGFIKPLDVISVLNSGKISFILVGLYGIGGWIHKPRATQDVDVLVSSRQHNKAVSRLISAFPHLKPDNLPVGTCLREPTSKRPVIDVKRPREPLYRHALNHSRSARFSGQRFSIPSLEMALAMRFAVMVSHDRPWEDKYQAAHDFIYMAKSNPRISLKNLCHFGELVYPGQGKELIEKVRRIRAGEKFIL